MNTKNHLPDTSPIQVAIMMGSKNDWSVMSAASTILDKFGIAHEARVLSAHRTPDEAVAYTRALADRGAQCVIAGAGGAAHLPGVIAANTTLPVLGVPIAATPLAGVDALYAIVQMPRGIPVATFAVGEAGAANAALFAVALMALSDKPLADKLTAYRAEMRTNILNTTIDINDK